MHASHSHCQCCRLLSLLVATKLFQLHYVQVETIQMVVVVVVLFHAVVLDVVTFALNHTNTCFN